MKKPKIKIVILFATIICALFLTGCNKIDKKSIRDKFIKEIEELKGYYLEGELQLTNNDDSYKYDVKVSYKKDDLFKVVLINKNNNYEQTILRNDEGVYVVTPSLNKSFKFQSEWPYNNSQSYLLQSIANDLKEDEEYLFSQKDKTYIFTTKVNYPNNPTYIKQNIILDEEQNLKKVEVLDENNISYITFTVTKQDKKATFNNNYFSLETITDNFTSNQTNNESQKDESNEIDKTTQNNEEQNQDDNQINTEKTSNTIEETLFPLYLPTNTTLSNKETIETNNGQRIIMTFSGDNPFILVQETVSKEEELTIIPTYGEPYLLIDTVGSLTDISYTWTSNGIEYYIVSDVMNQKELLEVAKSINTIATIGEK